MKPYLEEKVKEALGKSATEIERMRREVELLSIKAQAYDALAGMIKLLTPRSGYETSGIDAVWILRGLLLEIENAGKKTDDVSDTTAST